MHTTEHTVHGGGGAVACSAVDVCRVLGAYYRAHSAWWWWSSSMQCSGCVQSAGCILQSTQCMVVVVEQ